MAYNEIVNGAPLFLSLGTQDRSTRQVPREPDAIPTHLPKVFFYAKKGPTTPQLAVGGSRSLMYGDESFDPRSKYFNHATLFANAFNQEGNACMYQRVLPKDAGPNAHLFLSLELIKDDQLDDYERNSDGSFKIEQLNSQPKVKGQIEGYKARWLITYADDKSDKETKFGKRTVTTGTLTATGGSDEAKIYPIMDLGVSYVGEDGNRSGIRIWAPNKNTVGSFDSRIMKTEKVYPFRVAVIRKHERTGSARIQETLFGEQSVLTCFKPGAQNVYADQQLNIEDNFLDAYRNLTDRRYPPVFGEFGELFVYQDNIDTVLTKLYQAEKEYIDNPSNNPATIQHDFDSKTGVVDEDKWLFNFFTGMSTQAYPYHTFRLVGEGGSVALGEYTNLYASGSKDGTMNDTEFAKLVSEQMDAYLDPNNTVHNTALNVESIIYDSGFPLETKYDLLKMISHRKDTFVALGTYEVGAKSLTASEDNSRAIALRTRAQFYPESDYFGTHVMRALIMGRDGKLRSSQYKQRISPLYEVAAKSAAYMGAGNGVWKNGKHFDGAPGSIVDHMYDISVPYTSAGVRNRDWDAGLNWVMSYDLKDNFIPALRTVYNDDTSILNSYFNAMICCEIQKVAERAWRYYSGVTKLTPGQIANRIDEFIKRNTEGRFDSRVIVEPQTYYTDADKARGYSGTTAVKLYGNNQWTVMSMYIQAFRLSDYTGQ